MTTPPASIIDLLTRLEALLRGAGERSGPRASDAEEALGLVRMIRVALPAELTEVHRLRQEAERIHRQAQDEARRIVLEAQATARRAGRTILEPPTRGVEDLAQVSRQAREVRDGADAYAAKVLGDLEDSVLRVLEAIRKGKQLLKDVGR